MTFLIAVIKIIVSRLSIQIVEFDIDIFFSTYPILQVLIKVF